MPPCRNSSLIKIHVPSFRKSAHYTTIFCFKELTASREKGNATAIRQIIDDYKQSPYLTSTARTHLDDLEYLSEKADFELLKPAIVSSESLGMLQDFLCTHRYKEFRDQANALWAPFILQTIISTPYFREIL